MKRAIKFVAIVIVCLVAIVALLVGFAVMRADQVANRKIEVTVAPVAFANTPEALAQGKYLFDSRGCGECHGDKGEGRVMIDNGKFFVRTPNISPGGVTARYTERDWELAIRHGVKPDGKPIFLMPAEDYNRLTDADLAAVVAYARSLPAAPPNPSEIRKPLVMQVVYGLGLMQDAAAKIDHTLPPSTPVQVGVSAAYGAYVAKTCIGCHGDGLSGGKIPGGPPSWPAAANLTSGKGSAMPIYDSAEKFRALMRTGKRPDGSAVSVVMPFGSLKNMSDVDLDAMYAFLKTVPTRDAGGR
ncbi:MAG: c-type cytochrome [Betaproteobacteria bacterium]